MIIKNAEFLLPNKKVDLEKWACIACDQHTSDLSYWKSLENFVGDDKSTLHMILPEVYLEESPASQDKRKKLIVDTIKSYIDDDVFTSHEGMVLVERKVSNGKTRTGILLAVDLDSYDFAKGTTCAIRASEGTVIERIPPRVAVRKECVLELPHIMLLYDDKKDSIVKAAKKAASSGETLYDFILNKDGGHIKGVKISNTDKILKAFDKLLAKSKKQLGQEFLFAVGDGNHSLASAKQIYEDAKLKGQTNVNRYAIVEVVNIYDEALQFEPIHRLVFTKGNNSFNAELQKSMPSDPIAAVAFVDDAAKKGGFEVDYIHGVEHLEKLSKEKNATAVELKSIDKSGFFPYILTNGALPKKTFSMGEAEDKRYYLEAGYINLDCKIK